MAKDLTKLGGKTVTKLVTPGEQSTRLFRLVSLLTGWRNSLKGVGYFAGSALVTINYELALGSMMALIVIAWPFAFFGLGKSLGTAKKKNATWADIFITSNTNLLWLSAARLFLFASRDFWFEVPLPYFLRSSSCAAAAAAAAMAGSGEYASGEEPDPSSLVCGGPGWERVVVGAILGREHAKKNQSGGGQKIVGYRQQEVCNVRTVMIEETVEEISGYRHRIEVDGRIITVETKTPLANRERVELTRKTSYTLR